MDLLNGNEEDSAEVLTNNLKGMLKINGSSEDGSQKADAETSPTKTETSEDGAKKESIDEGTSDNMESKGPQTIDLSEVKDGECISINSAEVTIITSPESDIESNSPGSDKVRIRPITKFEWEHKYYIGTLVSVTNNYKAYAIKSRSYAVRIINRNNTSDRLLLRGFTAPVCDVSFAHSTSTLISAVDEDGNFLIWQLSLNGDNTASTKKLHVKGPPDLSSSPFHRLVWLTYMHCDVDGANIDDIVPLDGDPSDPDPINQKRLLAVTYRNIVEVWDINAAFEVAENEENETERDRLSGTYMTIKGHEADISDCELSPEGSVIAVASHDGFVKFWQVNIESTEEPTCLHKWKPHGDRPVSLVTFCDDRKQPQLVLYWRFMLTGCNQNNELKIWCTVSWTCLQTINFEPSPGVSELPALKCALHAASDYLIISDVNRKVLYVLQCMTDLEKGNASLSSISQYFLTSPLLSFAIIDAQKCKFKSLVAMDDDADNREDNEDIAQESDEDKEEEDVQGAAKLVDSGKRLNGVLIKLISIHTKSLESLDIRFIPNPSSDETMSMSTYNTISDDLNIVSVDESLSIVSPSLDIDQSADEQDDQQQEDEAESSKNKTALTVIETGDQSTLIGANEEEDITEQYEKDEKQKSGEDMNLPPLLPRDIPLRTSVMDLVGDVTDDLPVAHSSPSGGRSFSMVEDSLTRGQGEGEALTVVSPAKSDSHHPVLLTPDAFTASMRKPEDLASAADSSFTRITPFSVDHPSLFGSERDKTIEESLTKSPIMPSSISPPPGFQPVAVPRAPPSFKLDTDNKDLLGTTTSTVQSSIDLGGHSTYHALLPSIHSLSSSEHGPFGDAQTSGFKARAKSPDLISSASSIENLGLTSMDGRMLVKGPLSGAVGGGGDSLFMTRQAKTSQDFDVESLGSNASRKSDLVPTSSPAPWPRAPDVTMSKPTKKPITSSRDDLLRASDLTSQIVTRPDSALHANNRDIQDRTQLNGNIGADLLSAIAELQRQQEEAMKSHQKENMKKTNQIMKNVDAVLKKFDQQQNDKLDRALRSMSDSQRKFQTELRAHAATSSEQAITKMDRSIRHEIKNTVLPGLSRSMDPFKDQLHTSLNQKLTATDIVLKESIGKLVKSKDTVDAIGMSVGRVVQSQVHASFRESFTQVVVPAMEKSCNSMFQQLSITFQRGMDEVVSKLEKQFNSRVKAELERVHSTEKQAREATSELRDVAANAHSKIAMTVEQEVQRIVNKEMKSTHANLTEEFKKTFQRQHEAALREQKAVLAECIRSTMAEIPLQSTQERTKLLGQVPTQPSTPGRSSKPSRPTFEQQQETILSLLHQGNLNSAFQRALTASDLSLVMYVCEMVDPTVVFGTVPCSLHQPILLSLIQQLSCDLERNTTTKLKYLQEAVMNLDRSHQVTQEHMHTVLDSLVKNLDAHVATLAAKPTDSSNTPIIKEMRMLSMAAKSLIQ